MEKEDLYRYKMTAEENGKWDKIQQSVRNYCERLGIAEEYHSLIERVITTNCSCEIVAGYCEGEGYYYIEEGDRGAIFLKCQCDSPEEMCFYIMHNKVLRDVGMKLELKNRAKEEKNWMYYIDHKNVKPGYIPLIQNENYKYHTKYDSRKMWFEYVIENLLKIFDMEKVEKVIIEYTGYMNWWFEDEHWKFDCEKMEFVEISDSKEHD